MILSTTENFHEFRRKGLCGSDIAAILGLSNWATSLDVYMRIKENVDNFQTDNERMRMGRMLESVICERYQEDRKVEVERSLQIIHDKYDYIRGNIDAYNNKLSTLVEFKNVGAENMRKWYVDGKWTIPIHYKLQIAWYCLILDPKKSEFGVLFNGNQFQIIPYERNLKLEERLFELGLQWWEKHIVQNCKPKPTKVSDIDRYTRIKKDTTIEATKEIEDIIKEMKKIKEISKKIDPLKEKVKLYMQDKEILIDREGYQIATFKEVETIRVDTFHLKQDKLYEKYSRSGLYKRLCCF